ncbi:MAG: hypothetical protein RLZZ453_780 [Chlamydiota bacterium]|jgi:DNA-3-methyladenine glycosylase I
MNRCFGSHNPLYAHYHDTEWGVPVYNDTHLFEMLILEGAQAGLSWETILKRRAAYRTAFHNFDPTKVALMTDNDLNTLLHSDIIRNRQKIYSARQNAKAFLAIQEEFGTFSDYLWKFVNYTPIMTPRNSLSEISTSTPLSVAISKDLKKRGMTFVGPTIIYAFMQAVGVVNDHLLHCPFSQKQPSAPEEKQDE